MDERYAKHTKAIIITLCEPKKSRENNNNNNQTLKMTLQNRTGEK